jgi:hypothetical protein
MIWCYLSDLCSPVDAFWGDFEFSWMIFYNGFYYLTWYCLLDNAKSLISGWTSLLIGNDFRFGIW